MRRLLVIASCALSSACGSPSLEVVCDPSPNNQYSPPSIGLTDGSTVTAEPTFCIFVQGIGHKLPSREHNVAFVFASGFETWFILGIAYDPTVRTYDVGRWVFGPPRDTDGVDIRVLEAFLEADIPLGTAVVALEHDGYAYASTSTGSIDATLNGEWPIETETSRSAAFTMNDIAFGGGVQLAGRAGADIRTSKKETAGGGGGGGGSCADQGQSCVSAPNYVMQKTSCRSNTTQRSCYCAAVTLNRCLINNGCYAEAGAPTTVTQGQLESLIAQNNSAAASLGGGPCR